MGVMDLLMAVAEFEQLKHDIDEAQAEIIKKGCEIIQEEAQHVLGTDGYNWPALSPATKKTQPGMLLETGEMRDSIEWTAEKDVGYVGSNNDKAVYHELGTSKIPPRSFLMGAAVHKMPEILVMAVKELMKDLA